MIERMYAEYAWEKTETLLSIDSPSGFTEKAASWVRDAFAALGFNAHITAKGGVLVDLGGEDSEDGLLLEALETHPQYRKRGYAKQLIMAALKTAECDRVYVHISRRNAPSIATHRSCGFRKILDHSVYADGSVLRSSDTYRYEKPTPKGDAP